MRQNSRHIYGVQNSEDMINILVRIVLTLGYFSVRVSSETMFLIDCYAVIKIAFLFEVTVFISLCLNMYTTLFGRRQVCRWAATFMIELKSESYTSKEQKLRVS